MNQLKWEPVEHGLNRAKVPGGWLYMCYASFVGQSGLAFVPDDHDTLTELASNKETIVSSSKLHQIDADEPRKCLSISGPERLINKLENLLTGEQQ